MREKARAAVVAGAFLVLSAWICIEALRVPLGTFRMPGAGFFPLVLGLVLGALALALLAMGLANPPPQPSSVWPDRPAVLYLVASIVAGAALFERAGFVLTMALFLAVAMTVLGGIRPRTAMIAGLVGSVVAYLVFSRALLIALPSGLLPF